MSTVHVVVTVFTVLINAGMAAAGFAGAKFVRDNSTEVGVPPSWLPALAALKAAGAAGLVLGLLGVRPIGIAAAIGLVLFFVGAMAAHVRARVYYSLGFPAVFLAAASASLATALIT